MCGILSLEWSHAQPTGRKPMYKSCHPENMVYGNSHKDKQLMICGTPGLYRSPCQGKDLKTRLTANDVKRGSRR